MQLNRSAFNSNIFRWKTSVEFVHASGCCCSFALHTEFHFKGLRWTHRTRKWNPLSGRNVLMVFILAFCFKWFSYASMFSSFNSLSFNSLKYTENGKNSAFVWQYFVLILVSRWNFIHFVWIIYSKWIRICNDNSFDFGLCIQSHFIMYRIEFIYVLNILRIPVKKSKTIRN